MDISLAVSQVGEKFYCVDEHRILKMNGSELLVVSPNVQRSRHTYFRAGPASLYEACWGI
jgi:hypothetical protein